MAEAMIDSTVYSHSTILGSVIEAFGLGDFLTERDKQSNKLTQKYLLNDGTHFWQTDTPDLVVPVQPQSLDDMQRELLNGTVNLDPHPKNRNTLRTQDIQDPAQAKAFLPEDERRSMGCRIAAQCRQLRASPKQFDPVSADVPFATDNFPDAIELARLCRRSARAAKSSKNGR
jgi:hypothetical protein